MNPLNKLFRKKDISVLIADDDASMRQELSDYVRDYAGKRYVSIDTVAGFSALVNMATSKDYNLIITDNAMVDVSDPGPKVRGNEGIEATSQLREAGVTTPIVVISGSGKSKEALNAGANSYLDKLSWRGGLTKLLRQYLG
jgi:CheY-like chemotaxis protein